MPRSPSEAVCQIVIGLVLMLAVLLTLHYGSV